MQTSEMCEVLVEDSVDYDLIDLSVICERVC